MAEDQSNHFSGNVALKAIIEKKSKFLVCRGMGDTVWEFPGGRLHKNESPQMGLAREIKEELNLTVEVGVPIHICRSYHGKSKAWQIIAGFSCTITGSSELHANKEEVEECKWVSTKELKALPMFNDCREIADVLLATQRPK